MSHILVKVLVNMNADRFGGQDSVIELAISGDKEKLEEYCQETFGQATKKEDDKFAYEYYEIMESNMKIM